MIADSEGHLLWLGADGRLLTQGDADLTICADNADIWTIVVQGFDYSGARLGWYRISADSSLLLALLPG